MEVALHGDGECLVTGNQDHFPTQPCRGIKVFSPARFIKHHKIKKDEKDWGKE